jgi:hypothetical protein
MVHYRVHKSLPLVSILKQMNPANSLSSFLGHTLILTSYIRQGLTRLCPPGFPTKILCAYIFTHMHPIYFDHFILLNLIILIILSKRPYALFF